MFRSTVAFFGLYALSIAAFAQTPAWFVLKHPEVATMERMQAKEELAAKEAKMKTRLASHDHDSHHAMAQQNEVHGS